MGYRPYPVMPPRKNNGPIVAFVVFGVLLLAIGGVGLLASKNSSRATDAGYNGYASSSPTYTYSETTTTTTTETTTTTRTTSSRPSSTPTTQAGPKAVVALADHPIHRTNIGAMDINGCGLPGMSYDPAGQERFLRAALGCIETMWKPAMARANLPYQPAELQIVTQDMQYPCGTVKADQTARYCQGTIYWTANNYANDSSPNHPGKYIGQLAHEYGHHIQWLSGLLKASGNAQYDAGGWDTPKGLDLNRRMELQATCFGGMSLAPLSHGAIPMDVINHALQDAGQRGDYPQYPYRDHGTPERNSAWVNHGYKNNNAAACNTWAAGDADVA
ncbi:peptidase [Lentzea sp. NBRC 105346]|nr:peptidase [Lentzea sp. NBRC 105346]